MKNKSSNPPVLRFITILALMFSVVFGSISNQTNRIGPFIPTSLPATLSVTFPYQNTSDLLVLDLGQGGTTRDPPVVLTLNSDYTVTGGGYNSSTQMQSGNVVVVGTGAHTVLANDYIVILRNSPVTQTTVFSTTGILTGPMIEKALDKGITVSQQLTEASGRALRFEGGETLDGTLVKSARAGKLLGFDVNGAIEYSTGSSGAGTTYTAGAGLVLASNTFSVSPTQSFTALTVTNPITGSVTGNSGTATALQNARSINGVSFDGTADITVTAAAGTLTGTTLASNVTASSLTSAAVGTFASMATQAANAVNVTGGTVNGATVTGLPAPSVSTDAATKAYVDSISAGIVPRSAVVAATTANITLSGTQTIDGQAVIAGNRVLVKNQALTKENGIYDCAAGAWARSADSNTAAELLFGYYYFVSSGTAQGATSWFIQTAPTVLGTDPVVFAQFSASAAYSAGTGLGLAGNVFSISSAQSGLAITSSTYNGTVGATTPGSVAATTLSATGATSLTTVGTTGNATVGAGGTGANSLGTNINGGSGFNGGAYVALQKNSVSKAFFGTLSAITGGTSDDVWFGSVANNVGLYAASAVVASFSPTGLALTGSYSIDTNAHLRTTKGNFNLTVNVRDYGAVGDGATDDRAAINSAIAALVSHGTLYFPAGKYRITGGVTAFASLSYITVTGDGAEIYNDSGASGANTLVFDTTCSHIDVRNLAFTGTASVRGNGIHIRMGASYSTIENCYFQGCSDFGVLVSYGNGGWVSGCKIVNCISVSTLGDGFHIGSAKDTLIANCSSISTGDDGLGIIADYASYQPTRIEVTGFTAYQAGNPAGGGTHGCGIRIDEAIDVHVVGGQTYQSAEAGLFIGRNSSTTAYNVRIVIEDFKVLSPLQSAGMLGGISVQFSNSTELRGCTVDSPLSASGIALLDCNDLVVTNCTVRNAVLRGIAADDGTTTNVAANWSNWHITGNTMLGATSNETFYITPASGKTITNLIISGNTEMGAPVGNYIFTNRLATAAKINNNTSLEGRTIVNGGSGVAPTTANNN